MPDQHGFNHLGGAHQCIWCEWPGYGIRVSETDRARHARKHKRERERELERQRLENLRLGRLLKRQTKRENEQVYDE